MSYSSLIFKDAPLCVWSLEEPNGASAVFCDTFTNDASKNGVYNTSKVFMSFVPITYGGSFSVQNLGSWVDTEINYASNNILFTVPSQDIFSSKTRNKEFSLEFWMNLEIDPTALASSITSKIGESEIVTFSGSTNTGLYIRDLDYLVFKLGDTGKQVYESCIHVSNFNSPLHIALVYNKNSIQIFVNGEAGSEAIIDSDPFTAYESRNIEFRFPAKISTSSEHFLNINYDTVAIYNQVLLPSTLKRHYVYGVGKNVPRDIFSSLGGVAYGSNMQRTLPQKQINYLNKTSWTSNVTLNNLVATNNNLSTVKFPKPKLIIKDPINNQKTFKDMIQNDSIVFPSECFSYLEISNYESITGGTKKVEAKFEIDENHDDNVQVLLHVSSLSNPSVYLSFKIEDREVSLTVSGEEELTYTINSLSTKFFISYYLLSGVVYASIRDDLNGSASATFSAFNIFPMQNAYLRFGSLPVFFLENIDQNISVSDINRFDGKLLQVDIYNTLSPTTSWSNYPALKSGVSLYQMYANSSLKKVSVATKGSFELTISLANLLKSLDFSKNINQVGLATKVVVGSQATKIKYNFIKVTNGTETVIESDQDIRKLNLPYISSSVVPLVSDTQYKIVGELFSTDSDVTPGILDYLSISSYPVLKDSSKSYIAINSDNSGSHLRYYSNLVSGSINYPFKSLPDIDQTTDLYRSFNTGFSLGEFSGTKPYIHIPVNTSSIGSDQNIHCVMFAGILKSGSASGMALANLGGIDVSWATPEPPGTELYINGLRYSASVSYNKNAWNFYAIRFISGVKILATNTFNGNSGVSNSTARVGAVSVTNAGSWGYLNDAGTGGGSGQVGGNGVVRIKYSGTDVRAGGGNIISTVNGFTVHTFIGDGTFSPNADLSVDYLVVGGGGGGGGSDGASGASGASGGAVTGTCSLKSVDELIISIGQGGGAGGANSAGAGAGGKGNGSVAPGGYGGNAGTSGTSGGGGGGGAGTTIAVNGNYIAIAGGGGGGGGANEGVQNEQAAGGGGVQPRGNTGNFSGGNGFNYSGDGGGGGGGGGGYYGGNGQSQSVASGASGGSNFSATSDLKIGLNSSSNWMADNISVFTKNITETDIQNFYKQYFGNTSVKVVDSHPVPFTVTPSGTFKSSILVLDSEISNGQNTFQPLVGQSGFHPFSLCPRLASTLENGNWALSGTAPNFVYTFGTNRDNQKIDNIEPDLNDLILLKNQTTLSENGIYLVSDKTSTSLSLIKQTNPTNNYLVFVKEGAININYYFVRTNSNTYINSLVQRKIPYYDKNGSQITITIPVV